MTKYDIIFESLQEKVNSGELTVEDAQVLNDVAYEKYGDDDTEYEEVTESSDDEGVTYDEYLESMEEELFGEATRLAKEIHKKTIQHEQDGKLAKKEAINYRKQALASTDANDKKRFNMLAKKKLTDSQKAYDRYYQDREFDTLMMGRGRKGPVNDSVKYYGNRARRDRDKKYNISPDDYSNHYSKENREERRKSFLNMGKE